jgi:hypothetical protein
VNDDEPREDFAESLIVFLFQLCVVLGVGFFSWIMFGALRAAG